MASLQESNMDELYADAARSDNKTGADLLEHLKEECVRYKAEILPLYPAYGQRSEFADSFENFDEAKNEFLESLWDVIYQYFTDTGALADDSV